MISIENKALEQARKIGGDFVIKPVSISCGWSGGILKNLWIEVQKNFNDSKNYLILEYGDIKIYIHKDLEIYGDIYVYQKFSLPFLGASFAVKGISIKWKHPWGPQGCFYSSSL